jgi:hypothetical protein
MPARTLLLVLAVSLVLPAAVSAESEFLPAGMLLTCTLDEPNLSSKSAEIGDPVLCHIGTTTAFGRQVFPRGSYLTGHLQAAKDPGHFYGKGWLLLEFDRLVLPGEAVLPLAAKIVSVPHYKVERDGKIRGQGHAARDAVEWSIPPLWPVKILALPARGPYPALKGEVRITLRLMEDVAVPTLARVSPPVPMPPWASARNTSNKGLRYRVNAAVRETLGQEQ